MKFSDLFQTASAGLWRNKGRTFLTITAIFIGATTITLTNGIGTGVKSYLSQQVSSLGTNNELQIIPLASAGNTSNNSGPAAYNPKRQNSSNGVPVMTAQDIVAIKAIPGIQTVEPDYAISPEYITGKGSKYVLTTVAQKLGATSERMIAGTSIDNASGQNQIDVPQGYVTKMGYGDAQALIGKQIMIGVTDATGQQHRVAAIATGVVPKSLIAPDVAYVNTAFAQALHTAQSVGLPSASADSYTMVLASFSGNVAPAQIVAIKNNLSAKGYDARTLQDTEHTFFTIITVIIMILDAFGAIALIAAMFGIINTLYMAVQERTKEIGLMKALGMSRHKIFVLFSIEAVLIGFLGSTLGVVFAALLGKLANVIAANGFLKDVPGLTLLTFPFSTIAGVIIGIMLLAFLAGTLPARRASKKNPIDALRYE